MLIRRAFIGDLEALAGIESEYPDYPAWGKNGLAAEFGKAFSVTLVAENAGSPAGFINFWILHPQIQLNSIVVAAAVRRTGVAAALIGKLEEYAKKSGCAEVDLEVNERNSAALALYGKLGFEVVGRRPKFYNNSDAAILMRKTLRGEK